MSGRRAAQVSKQLNALALHEFHGALGRVDPLFGRLMAVEGAPKGGEAEAGKPGAPEYRIQTSGDRLAPF